MPQVSELSQYLCATKWNAFRYAFGLKAGLVSLVSCEAQIICGSDPVYNMVHKYPSLWNTLEAFINLVLVLYKCLEIARAS
jgi:hypothetical protein